MNMKREEIISQAMSLLGSRKSKRKSDSSRRNGRLGGRPPKEKTNATKPDTNLRTRL